MPKKSNKKVKINEEDYPPFESKTSKDKKTRTLTWQDDDEDEE